MPDFNIELLNAFVSITANISTFSVLLWWINVERKRSDAAWALLAEDWKRQREEEIERRAEEKFQRKMSVIPAGTGL